MPHHEALIGRERERAELHSAFANAKQGRGGVLLLAGEAGVGKTTLAEASLTQSGLLTLRAGAVPETTPPYGPIVTLIRACLRLNPDGLAGCGRLAGFIALLLPELGPASEGGDRATLFEAIRCVFDSLARRQPAALFIDDLQWADNATLELLPALASSLTDAKLLIIGAYRSDEIPRGHPVRRMRIELRRKGLLREIAVGPLDQKAAVALAARALGDSLTPSLAAAMYDRTQGVPFFVEELASALATSGRIEKGQHGFELAGSGDLPVPDTVRDAVLLRAERLSTPVRQALDAAAVLGQEFDPELAAELSGAESGIVEAVECGLVVEAGSGRAAFRHALTREAIYSEIGWPRRRALHREIAARLEKQKAPLNVVAEHWQLGRDLARARYALVEFAERSCAVHAYRDAAQAARRALELWPEGEEEARRLDVLDRLGSCAQLNGDQSEAARAWREVAEQRRLAEDWPRLADTRRRLASVYELQVNWEAALAARRAAAEAFTQAHLLGEAAAECLAVAGHLIGACQYSAALEMVAIAAAQAERAGRLDLQISALAAKGECLSKLGQYDTGRQAATAALTLALEQNLIGPASEAYSGLAGVLQQAGDYSGSRDTYHTGIEFCQTGGMLPMAQICLACLAVVLREMGAWDEAVKVCQEVLASPEAGKMARLIVNGMLGAITGWRGQARQARGLLLQVLPEAQRLEKTSLEIDCLFSLASVEELYGDSEVAAARYRELLQRWEKTEERHYIVPALRWAATFFAGIGAQEETRACARALAAIASATGTMDAVAALAHALGETALLDGEARLAAEQFQRALDALSGLEAHFDRTHVLLRAGVALAANGERALGIERLTEAYRAAVKLKVRPLAERAARELVALGEKVDKRLGRKAARELEHGGLTPREREVLRRIVLGRTNREIAQDLFLSPRTVDMFVRNILNKLNCNSRLEASRKAEELGLLARGS